MERVKEEMSDHEGGGKNGKGEGGRREGERERGREKGRDGWGEGSHTHMYICSPQQEQTYSLDTNHQALP